MNEIETISKEFASDLLAATKEIEGARKDSTNPYFSSTYADLESVISAVKPALNRNNITVLQRCTPGTTALVETLLLHSSGAILSLGAVSVPFSDQKNPAQAYGAALTYGRRYSLATALGVPQVDDDGNTAHCDRLTGQYREEKPRVAQPAQPRPAIQQTPASQDDIPEDWAAPQVPFGLDPDGPQADKPKYKPIEPNDFPYKYKFPYTREDLRTQAKSLHARWDGNAKLWVSKSPLPGEFEAFKV